MKSFALLCTHSIVDYFTFGKSRLSLISMLLIGSVFSQEPKSNPKSSDSLALISSKLKFSTVTIGDEVELVESVPNNLFVEIIGFSHIRYRSGIYDKELNGIRNLQPKEYVLDDNLFAPGLPFIEVVIGEVSLPKISDTTVGRVIKFKPNRIGIFSIQSLWIIDDKQSIASAPVILTVLPPKDKLGVNIIKDEWLK